MRKKLRSGLIRFIAKHLKGETLSVLIDTFMQKEDLDGFECDIEYPDGTIKTYLKLIKNQIESEQGLFLLRKIITLLYGNLKLMLSKGGNKKMTTNEKQLIVGKIANHMKMSVIILLPNVTDEEAGAYAKVQTALMVQNIDNDYPDEDENDAALRVLEAMEANKARVLINSLRGA